MTTMRLCQMRTTSHPVSKMAMKTRAETRRKRRRNQAETTKRTRERRMGVTQRRSAARTKTRPNRPHQHQNRSFGAEDSDGHPRTALQTGTSCPSNLATRMRLHDGAGAGVAADGGVEVVAGAGAMQHLRDRW
jgi:hypothetical protein